MLRSTPAPGHVLIVDDDETFRAAVVTQLQQSGWQVTATDSYASTLELMRAMPDVTVVILDHPTVGSDVRGFVQELRDVRASATIVGNSGYDRRAEFADAGVSCYLQKPWRLSELLALLPTRIGECVECNRPLPLRLPRPGETGQSWVCASCGARYRAVLDESAPPDLRSYVDVAT